MTAPLLAGLPSGDAARDPRGARLEPDDVYAAFVDWTRSTGLDLYPHQDEAVLEILTGAHVILATPTGSGKSLVAVAAHSAALARGVPSYYTAPTKALVSEKFFALVDVFGAERVGMLTGDVAVNADAPILCCTAEILAATALREGPDGPSGEAVVVADEFHFYADPQRGWAWQVPLLELTRAQFVLMSATLGDVTFLAEDLRRRTGREVAVVTTAQRPVPLSYTYSLQPLQDLLLDLVGTGRAPAYVVHATQAAAVEQAQALTSVPIASRAQRDAILEAIADVRFGPGFGSTLSRLLRAGIGVHHAGMLPRYRRLVERLTQQGLLGVLCGTDTLGVGINVPIRTVVLTQLTKYDGVRVRHLTAREFHQVAGRAGRAGFDTEGEVIVQAPEHVIENAKALARAGDDERKRRRIVRKKAPEGRVNWTDKTFERLRDAPPEPLTSQFAVSHMMVLGVLARPGDPVAAMARQLRTHHEPSVERDPHLRAASGFTAGRGGAGLVDRLTTPDAAGRRVRLTVDLPEDFALTAPLSPFALAALELLDRDDPGYALDVVSVVEATLDDPRPLLVAQEKAARGEAVAALKAEGVEYEERMALLEGVTHPRPLADLLEPALAVYRTSHPWVADYELRPKSVVREMAERAMTFPELVSRYGLARSEGVILRYLSDAVKALRRLVPPEARTEELEDLLEWLGETVLGVDSSLLAEWEALAAGGDAPAAAGTATTPGEAPDGAHDGERPVSANTRAFRVLVRNALFRRVELAAREDYVGLAALDAGSGWDADAWADALAGYWAEYDAIGIGASARAAGLVDVVEDGRTWRVRQVLEDPDGDRDWAIRADVDLDASDDAGAAVLRIREVGPHTATAAG